MSLMQKIANTDQIENHAMHVQAMAWVLMAFAVILGLYLLYARFGKSQFAKSFHESDESTAVNVFWLLIIVGIIFGLMIFANNLPKKQMTDAGCDMIEKTMMFKSDSDGIDNYVAVPILVHGKNYQIGEVDAEYDNGDEEETLINAYVDFNRKASNS